MTSDETPDKPHLEIVGGEPTPPEPPKTLLEGLAESNQGRAMRVLSGQLGIAIAPPSIFDFMRLLSYLEDIGENLGIRDGMQINAEERIAERLDVVEIAAQKARLTAGGNAAQMLEMLKSQPHPPAG